MKVKFLKKYRKWKEGDIEEFKDKKALFLIRTGWAKKHTTKSNKTENKNGKPKDLEDK